MNADPRVMQYFPDVLTGAQSDALVDRVEKHFDDHGFGVWAVEVPGVAPFVGFIGLLIPGFKAHFTPCVEVGWRLSADYWGRGYAVEGARAAVAYGFGELGLREIVSMSVPKNVRSRRVMEKIGMTRDSADDFDHPTVPERMRRHVLYRLSSAEFSAKR